MRGVSTGGEPVLLPHSPELFATAKADYAYTPGATCPEFDRFVAWFTDGDPLLVEHIL
jgi:phage/plasmid-associated DNA primase